METIQIQYVQESFAQVKPISDQVATLFYERLFELDPNLRPYFKGDLSEQKERLMTTLTFVVVGLERPESILPAVQALGKRHMGYGVQESHYKTVGTALLWALRECLGDAFTAEVEAAWIAAYSLLANTMFAAAATVNV